MSPLLWLPCLLTCAIADPSDFPQERVTHGDQVVQVDVVVAIIDVDKMRKSGFSLPDTLPILLSARRDPRAFVDSLPALKKQGMVKLLVRPSVRTLSRKAAFCSGGGQIPCLIDSPEGSKLGRIPCVGVNVVPTVLDNGKILVEVSVDVNRADPSFPPEMRGLLPEYSTAHVGGHAFVNDGQTVPIGGIAGKSANAETSKTPILGDIPLIGAAFRKITYEEVDEELVVLVTARLVKAPAPPR